MLQARYTHGEEVDRPLAVARGGLDRSTGAGNRLCRDLLPPPILHGNSIASASFKSVLRSLRAQMAIFFKTVCRRRCRK